MIVNEIFMTLILFPDLVMLNQIWKSISRKDFKIKVGCPGLAKEAHL